MRYAIFSDVHANHEALSAVLKAYEAERIDRYICLGDTVGYGADPDACATAVKNVADVSIIGNHDAAVVGRMDYSYYYEAARYALDYHAHLLSPENTKWLRSLPYEHREGDIAFTRASPISLEEFEYVFSVDQARELLSMYDELGRVNFLGHSHLRKAFALSPTSVNEVVATRFAIREEFKYVISVGSVGQPRDYDPRASYTILDTDRWIFEFKRVEYDVEKAAQKIFDTDLERNFGNRLFLGV